MKIECSKNRLQKGIGLCERVVSHNLSLPILKNVLLETNKNQITLKATNLDIGIEINIPAKVDEKITTSFNPGVLSNFLTNLKDEDKIFINLDNENLHIETEFTNTLIKSESSEDFPNIPQVKDVDSVNIPVEDFVYGIKSVLYAATVSDIKPEIASVYIYKLENNLVFVATDSFRLAEKKVVIKSNIDDFKSIIIPVRNAGEIIKIFENEVDEIKISSNNNQISLWTGNTHFTSRLIDGVYPDYNQIMPKTFKTTIEIDKNKFIQSLKLTNIFSNNFNQIKIKVLKDKQQLSLESENADRGKNTTVINCKINGSDFEAYYNVKYILDYFNTSNNTNEVILGLNEQNKPLHIKGLDKDNFSYIIMPVNR